MVGRSTALPFHASVPSKSIVRLMISGGGGGTKLGGGGKGLSIFTACVTGGSEMMKMINSTNMTSINGVMLMSGNDWPSPLPTAMAILESPMAHRRGAVVGSVTPLYG